MRQVDDSAFFPANTLGLVLVLGVVYALSATAGFSQISPQIADTWALSRAACEGQWWRLISGNLLHANIAHLGFNALSILMFGTLLEREISALAFWRIILLAMLGCDVMTLLLLPQASIGASGIAFGLQAAFVGLQTQRLMYMIGFWRALWQLRGYMLVMLALGAYDSLMSAHINVPGHLGGALLGLLAGFLIRDGKPQFDE